MRQGTVGARRHDGGESQSRRAVGQHVELQLQRQFLFRHALFDFGQQTFEGFAGDAAGLGDAAQLVLVLDLANALHFLVQALPFHAGHGLAAGFESADGQVIVLIIQRVDLVLCAQTAHDRFMRNALFGHFHRKSGSLLFGLLRIAEVGDDGLHFPADQHQTLAGVAGKIEHVAGIMHQHGFVPVQRQPVHQFQHSLIQRYIPRMRFSRPDWH